MSDNIKNFSLSDCEGGDQGYQRVLLQLYGLLGNGKSSFINSCKFVLDDGDFKEHAAAGDSDGRFTKHRIPYELTNTIWMVDNRGMSKLDRFQMGEIFAQLGNLLPLNKEVEWCTDFSRNVQRLLEEHKKNTYSDHIVPIFIHSARNMINQEDLPLYRDLLNTTTKLTGITPIIVLTHKSSGGLESMRNVFKDMGLGKIYAIENYTAQDHQEVREKHKEILNFLTEVIDDVKFRMQYPRNPKEESYKHLQFLIDYIKTSEDNKREEENFRKLMEAEKEENKSKCLIL